MERRTIAELITLYELEPSIRDIYVEGPTDRAFVTAVLRRVPARNVQVREVDFISITATQLGEIGLGIGSRQRVIALALLLERSTRVDLSHQVACIADADEEAGHTAAVKGTLLLYTDASSMTVYAFAPNYIQWYLDIEVLGFPLTGEEVTIALTPILRTIAATRRAFRESGIDSDIVDPTKDCALTGYSVSFDARRFVERFAHKAGVHGRLPNLLDEVPKREKVMTEDARLWVNSEDFISLLHWLIVQLRGPANTVPKHLLARTLLLGIPSTDVLDWPLFRELLRKLVQPRAS